MIKAQVHVCRSLNANCQFSFVFPSNHIFPDVLPIHLFPELHPYTPQYSLHSNKPRNKQANTILKNLPSVSATLMLLIQCDSVPDIFIFGAKVQVLYEREFSWEKKKNPRHPVEVEDNAKHKRCFLKT